MKDLFGIMTAVMTITAMFVWGVTVLAARAAAVGRPGGGSKGEGEGKTNDEEFYSGRGNFDFGASRRRDGARR